MTIPEYARANFQTLVKAAKAGDLALMERHLRCRSRR
jgi:hypothetical protein